MKLNVGVFFGGESVEHEVSIISAHQAMEALDKNKYNVIPVYITKGRKLFVGEDLWDMNNYKDLKALEDKLTQVSLVLEDNKVVIKPVKASLFSKKELGTIDVAIPVMHGTNGEDGTIQGFFEMLKVPYAGCDLYGAAVGQDKVLQKHILADNDLPVTNWFWVLELCILDISLKQVQRMKFSQIQFIHIQNPFYLRFLTQIQLLKRIVLRLHTIRKKKVWIIQRVCNTN